MIKVIKKFFTRFKDIKVDEEALVSYEEKRRAIEHIRIQFLPEYFIETGTFLGDTTDYFKDSFKKLFSVELSESLALRAKKRFLNNSNVEIIHGDSSDKLPQILNEIDKTGLFWLDGHYSSEFYLNGEYFITAKADKNTPVETELKFLLNAQFPHLILIDDARLFDGTHDYPHLKKIEQKVADSSKEFNVFVKHDIIHILPVI